MAGIGISVMAPGFRGSGTVDHHDRFVRVPERLDLRFERRSHVLHLLQVVAGRRQHHGDHQVAVADRQIFDPRELQ